MVLDARLKKLAAGISVRKGAAAFVRSREAATSLTDLEETQANEFTATLEAMFLMAAVDGEISDEEIAQLRTSIAALTDLELVESAGLDPMMADFSKKLAADGWAARLDDVVARIPTEDGRAFAFRLAAGVAMVDDNVEHAEAAAIESLASKIGLTAEESQSILREVLDELFGG